MKTLWLVALSLCAIIVTFIGKDTLADVVVAIHGTVIPGLNVFYSAVVHMCQ